MKYDKKNKLFYINSYSVENIKLMSTTKELILFPILIEN